MILTEEEIAALAARADGAGPTDARGLLFARAVERAALEVAARRFDTENKTALWPEEVRDLLLFWASQDADGRLRETQRAAVEELEVHGREGPRKKPVSGGWTTESYAVFVLECGHSVNRRRMKVFGLPAYCYCEKCAEGRP